MKNYTLIAAVGKTDPIRSEHDGPILHIIRNYHPKRVFLVLSEEIGMDEQKYHYNEKAIHLLDKDCQVELVFTGIKDAHSYDDIASPFLKTCNQVKENYPDDTILLDISSGTPQMETALCMIALNDSERYLAVQVSTSAGAANKSPMFDPHKNSVEEWFQENKDNESGSENRCSTPKLLNFKRPLIQGQILSLIENYDYTAANQLYLANKALFSKETGLLLSHAEKRLNLEYDDAKRIAARMDADLKEKLYLIPDEKVRELVEFYNSMHIKQRRRELNDFALRIEILTEYLAIYLLEYRMKLSREDLCRKEERTNSVVYRLDKEKCERMIPGITAHLDKSYKKYEWGKELNARSMVQIAAYVSEKKEFSKYNMCIKEMKRWTKISGNVRNPAAHTIIAITDQHFKDSYDRNNSEMLCKNVERVLKVVFGNKVNQNAFIIYENLNQLIREALEK